MFKRLAAATALSVLLIGSARAGALNYDYAFRFTGTVTSVQINDRPEAVDPPFLAVGDPVHAKIGVNWIDEPFFREHYVDGQVITYPDEAIRSSGGVTRFWFTTTPDFGGFELAFGMEPTTGGFSFNARTGEMISVEGSGYGGIDSEMFYVGWGLDGGPIQQVAGGGLTVHSHWFTYEGSWEAIRMPEISPVPEPATVLLLIAGALGLGAGATARTRLAYARP